MSKKKETTVDDLVFDAANVRTHNDKNKKAIRNSVKQFKAGRSILVDADNVIRAGNGTAEAWQETGGKVRIIETDGSELIAVKRTDLKGAEAMAYAIADNRASELAEWDHENLSAQLEELDSGGLELEAIGFDSLDLNDFSIEPEESEVGEDRFIFSNDQILSAAFEFWRSNGFPFRNLSIHSCMQEINSLAKSSDKELIHTSKGYKVADTYNSHRFAASAFGMKSPMRAFDSDTDLKKALRMSLENGGTLNESSISFLSLVNGTQACSNFRPGFALFMYRKFCPELGTVLDTSTGYGGRLVGFFSSRAKRYVGIDPNRETFKANERMTNELGNHKDVCLINKPAEDVEKEEVGDVDFCFTSPPYFCKEIYSQEETQSWKRFKTGKEWKDGFLFKMLKLQADCLKKGGVSAVNISDVKIKGETFNLEEWTVEVAKKLGLKKIDELTFPMNNRSGVSGDDVAKEPVFIFQKV